MLSEYIAAKKDVFNEFELQNYILLYVVCKAKMRQVPFTRDKKTLFFAAEIPSDIQELIFNTFEVPTAFTEEEYNSLNAAALRETILNIVYRKNESAIYPGYITDFYLHFYEEWNNFRMCFLGDHNFDVSCWSYNMCLDYRDAEVYEFCETEPIYVFKKLYDDIYIDTVPVAKEKQRQPFSNCSLKQITKDQLKDSNIRFDFIFAAFTHFTELNAEERQKMHDVIEFINTYLFKNGTAIICVSSNFYAKKNTENQRFLIENGLLRQAILLPPDLSMTFYAGYDTRREYKTNNLSFLRLTKQNESAEFIDNFHFHSHAVREDDVEYFKEWANFENAINEACDTTIASLGFDPDEYYPSESLDIPDEPDEIRSGLVSYDTIRENNYVINPAHYLYKKKIEYKEVAQYVRLGDCAEILRGCQLSAEEINKYRTKNASNIRYLKLSDIQDNMIETDLEYLTALPPQTEKFCLFEGDVIVSKSALPYKFAVAYKPYRFTLVAGNMFIIRIKEESPIQPFFLKAFLESDLVIERLKKFGSGFALPAITKEVLSALEIPILSKEDQLRFEAEYKRRMQDIIDAKKTLRQCIDASKTIFKKYMEA